MRIRTIAILAVVLLLLVSGTIIFLMIYYAAITNAPPMNVTPTLGCSVINSGVLDYGNSNKIIYLLTQVNGKDLKEVNVSVNLYPYEVPSDIYLLDYSSPSTAGCYECTGLADFKKSLESSLKDYGLIGANSTLNQIKIYQLDKLTKRSIIIVPTGKIPSQLVGLENGSDLNALMKKGFVIIFIGSDLDESLKSTGETVNIPNSQLGQYGINYQKRILGTCPDVYKFKNPAFSISSSVQCAVSFINEGEGYFVVFPRSIDIGWEYNGSDAGEDVAHVIKNVVWEDALTSGSFILSSDKINQSNSSPTMVYLSPSSFDSGWARLLLIAKTLNDSQVYLPLQVKITNPVNGNILHSPNIVGGTDLLILFRLNENFTRPRDVNISVAVYKNLQRVKKFFVQAVNIQYGLTFSTISFIDFEAGNYTLRAEDDSGHVYAQSFLGVPSINVNLDTASWDSEPQYFVFSASIPDDSINPKAGRTPVANKQVYINLNNSPYQNTLSTPFVMKTDSNGVFNYTSPQSLSYGSYTFTLNISGDIVNIDTSRKKPQSWFDNPLNIAIVVLTILAGLASLVLRRPERLIYTIDVPDFPPLEKVIVPVSKFSILSLFDSLNKEYKWNFMPLSVQELKNEMRRKITYKGIPILITDYNLDKILEELIGNGDVSTALNLYGLKAWESKSGRSTRYLAIFRLLRNFLINNAIPFTDLNQRKDCDMLITVKGEPLYIHIYENEDTFRRALELSKMGKNFILFESRKEMENVLRKLDLSYNPLAVILKSEIGIGSIQFVHPGNFSEILGR